MQKYLTLITLLASFNLQAQNLDSLERRTQYLNNKNKTQFIGGTALAVSGLLLTALYTVRTKTTGEPLIEQGQTKVLFLISISGAVLLVSPYIRSRNKKHNYYSY